MYECIYVFTLQSFYSHIRVCCNIQFPPFKLIRNGKQLLDNTPADLHHCIRSKCSTVMIQSICHDVHVHVVNRTLINKQRMEQNKIKFYQNSSLQHIPHLSSFKPWHTHTHRNHQVIYSRALTNCWRSSVVVCKHVLCFGQ